MYVYVTFLIGYALQLLCVLLLVFPCGSPRRAGADVGADVDAVSNDGGATANGAPQTPPGARQSHEQARRGSTGAPETSTVEPAWSIKSTDEAQRNADAVAGGSSADRQDAVFSPNGPARNGARGGSALSRVWRNYVANHLLILHPTLQWFVFACIIARAIFCALLFVQYNRLAGHVNTVRSWRINIVALILGVSSQTIAFSIQAFVCVGWGCAYERLPVGKLVAASICSFIGFVAYVLDCACFSGTMSTTFTAFGESRGYAHTRCTSIHIFRRATEVLISLLNQLQLTTLMSTIGRAAATGETRESSRHFKDNMLLYLRYRGMCLPYAIGILLPHVLFVVFSETLMNFDDYYIECAVGEFVVWYTLAFVLLFLRKEQLFL